MSEVLQAILLGVIQGITEFLPISSTGHLVIAEQLLGLDEDEFGLRFDAAIHLGTLTAVIIYFRTQWLKIVIDCLSSIGARNWALTANSRLGWLLLLGTIPAGIAGALLESTAEDTFRSAELVAVMLILFSAPMWLAERFSRPSHDVANASARDALILGAAQCIALIPGVSRSGITIATGMLRGFRREEAAVFTFMLSAPIIAAAGGKQLFDIARGDAESSGLENEYLVYAAGLVTAGIVGYAAIALLVRFLRGNPLNVFIGYRIALGIIVLGLAAAGVL